MSVLQDHVIREESHRCVTAREKRRQKLAKPPLRLGKLFFFQARSSHFSRECESGVNEAGGERREALPPFCPLVAPSLPSFLIGRFFNLAVAPAERPCSRPGECGRGGEAGGPGLPSARPWALCSEESSSLAVTQGCDSPGGRLKIQNCRVTSSVS